MARSIRLPFIPDAVKTLTELSDDKFLILLDGVRTKYGIELPDSALERLSQDLDIENSKRLQSLFVFLKFAYQNVFAVQSKIEISKRLSSYVEDMSMFSFSEKSYQTNASKVVERLVQLLSDNEIVDIQSKRERVSTGILNSVTEFSSIVELRPNIDRARTKIREYVPMLIFEVRYDLPLKISST